MKIVLVFPKPICLSFIWVTVLLITAIKETHAFVGSGSFKQA